MSKKYGFIGAGNMGGVVAQAVCRSVGAANVLVFDPDLKKTAALSENAGCRVLESAGALAAQSDYVVLCVKPNMLSDVIDGVAQELGEKTETGKNRVVVSIAAGVSIAEIEAMLEGNGLKLPVIRLMPNTPMAVGRGMTVMACSSKVADSERAALLSALDASGEVILLDEKLIDAATPIFSCSPAFAYMFIDALADGGVMSGLPRETAIKLGAQAALGAAAMALESGKHPGRLKDEVCSPGGSTIAGVAALERAAFRSAVIEAVAKAHEKIIND